MVQLGMRRLLGTPLVSSAARIAHAVLFACAAGCDAPPLPSVYDDAALAAQIDDSDGIDGVAPRLGGFVHGRHVRYWSLGQASATPMPVYVLCARTASEDCAPIDHPPIADALPGEPAYSPFGRVHWLRVAPSWRGRIASFEEAERALASGEISSRMESAQYLHCPIAGESSALELSEGGNAIADGIVYVRGMQARCFDFTRTHGVRTLLPEGEMLGRHVYVIAREGAAGPLMEAAIMADLTGDGDQVDSNNVFGVDLDDGEYTPLWIVVNVRVPVTYASIDTHQDETMADYTRVEDMFTVAPDYTITPVAGAIVDHQITETLVNCPLQSADGAL